MRTKDSWSISARMSFPAMEMSTYSVSMKKTATVSSRCGRTSLRTAAMASTPQTQARIFEAFFTTKGFAGTGLGLWVSAEIMQRHQGRIRVHSSQHQ